MRDLKRAPRRRPRAARSPQPSPQSQHAASPLSPTAAMPLAVAAVLAAIATYLPALRNGFIWDDPLVLQQLQAIHSLRDLFILPPIIPHFYFRPLIFLSYLLDRELGGGAPWWFHASVITAHALNTALVFALARRLFAGDRLIAAGSALLFAVFPAHVESVAWMAGRSDVIACTFVLVTVLVLWDHDDYRWSALAGLAYLLGLLSKETGLACLALVPVLDIARGRRVKWVRYVPLLVATGVYFILRRQALGTLGGGTATAVPVSQLSLDLLRAVGFYTLQAIAPLRMCAYIPDVPSAWPYTALGAATLALPAAYAGWRPLRQRGGWQLGLLIAWFFATLAPSLVVIVRRSASAPVADRYVYLPSVASCVLVCWAIVRLAERRRLRWPWNAAAVALLAAVFAFHAVRYERIWADDLTFWSDVAAKAPTDALPQRELATALVERGRLSEAENALLHALASRADPEGRAMTYNNLGNLYRRFGRYEDAQRAFEAGLNIVAHPTLYHNLGMMLMSKIEREQQAGDQAAVLRDIAQARAAFEHALQVGRRAAATSAFPQWDEAKTHALLGQVLFSLGDRAGAREHLEAALRLQPRGPVADVTRRYMQKLQP